MDNFKDDPSLDKPIPKTSLRKCLRCDIVFPSTTYKRLCKDCNIYIRNLSLNEAFLYEDGTPEDVELYCVGVNKGE